MTEFTTITYLLSSTGMLFAVILLSQFIKKLFNIHGASKIQWVVFTWSVIFCTIAGYFKGDFQTPDAIVATILVWLVNSIIIWFAAMKAFEKIQGEDSDGVFILDQTNDETDLFRVDLGDQLAGLGSKEYVKLKVDTTTKLNT